eukprot:gnl/MRDRNA2_/MRDRNA2_61284_c0_seq1.p1 gnl/MRDRNA2_/MRDRNA2_61284_c0~~gnl/MRDRNA2_/MRDRNA2_61284_c0_seq1.p1  ORF type:complete len:695 (+),score=165.26 gnl/MRDRNA2_/MRDRNA2_61284_c0_seq1:94-2085(+)
MEITLQDSQGLPSRAYVSIRVGDKRRQAPMKVGEQFHFPSADHKALVIDVFEKVGSSAVSLTNFKMDGGQLEDTVSILKADGNKCSVAFKATMKAQPKDRPKLKPDPTPRHKAAILAKNYLSPIQELLQTMVSSLLVQKPEDPVGFLVKFLTTEAPAKEIAEKVKMAAKELASMDKGEEKVPTAVSPEKTPEAAVVPAEPKSEPPAAEAPEVEAKTSGEVNKEDFAGADCEAAAVKLQKMQRGKAARKRVNKIRVEKSNAAQESSDQVGEPPEEDLFKHTPGLGDEEYPGFSAVSCPDEMPDLSKHYSILADVLKKNPSLWARLKDVKTASGVTFAKCIKPGMDNKGHAMIKTIGGVAGDEESYTAFGELFDPIISVRHGGYKPDAKHPTNLDWTQISDDMVDSSHVISSQIRISRNVRGLRLPPAISKDDRRKAESLITTALKQCPNDLSGDYFALYPSVSYADMPYGMSEEDEDNLRALGYFFEEPDSTLLLASGMGRHWPDARGIFSTSGSTQESGSFVWVNEEDHIRISSKVKGGQLKQCFAKICEVERIVGDHLRQQGHDYMHSPQYGFITACPSNIGTTLRASVTVKVPLLGDTPDLAKICKGLQLQARTDVKRPGHFDIATTILLGISEVDTINNLIDGVKQVIAKEVELEAAQNI